MSENCGTETVSGSRLNLKNKKFSLEKDVIEKNISVDELAFQVKELSKTLK